MHIALNPKEKKTQIECALNVQIEHFVFNKAWALHVHSACALKINNKINRFKACTSKVLNGV